MSGSWFLMSTHMIWILVSKLILPNNRSRATLCVLDTCLIVGLRPSFIIFDHGFVALKKNVQLRLISRSMSVCGHIIHNITQLTNILSYFDFLGLGSGMKSRTSFLDASMSGVGHCCSLNGVLQPLRPKDQEHVTIHTQSSIQRNDFRLCRTVRDSGWFLPHPTDWNKMFYSQKKLKTLLEIDFESSRSPAKSESWNKPKSAMLWPCFPHDNIVRNQLC